MTRGAPGGPNLIALLTDFGDGSVYVGAMKGVIATLAPGHPVIDLAHSVEPQAVAEAAFLLAAAYRFFPPATTFVAVVDPGVGGAREIALLEGSGGRRFLAPDNGLLGRVLARELERAAGEVSCRYVRERRWFLPEVSATFHGRDIFAPVAARLAAGEVDPAALGPEVAPERLMRLPGPRARPGGSVQGTVVHADRFGNLVTDIEPPPGLFPRRAALANGRAVERAARTYAEAAGGEPFAYVGSFGTVELGLPMRSAAAALGAGPGVEVEVWFRDQQEAERPR